MKLLEHFKELTLHPKNAQELKGLILQLAVQGKLTRQWREENPDVEPGSELLKRIRSEKGQLIKEKKIKKENSFPEISSEEMPFNLPESWAWSRLSDYIHNFGQKTPDKEFEYIDVASIDNQLGVIINELNILSPNEVPSRARKIVQKGCVVYPTVRPYLLNIAVVDREFSYEAIASTAFAILNPILGCSEIYLYYVLRSYFFIEYVESCMKGVAYPAINDANLLVGLIPIPPLEEQTAIVEIVNQLFAEVEQLETLTKERIQLKEDFVTSVLNRLNQAAEQGTASQWAFLQEQFGTFFTEKGSIKKLREGILQLAVQGKLTHHWRSLRQAQGPPMEPASELLEKIKAEKEELIKAGKIKKEKPLPEISEKDIPYGLPEGWIWEYLGNSMLKITDGTHHSPTNIENGDFKYISAKNIKEDGIKLSNITYVTKEAHREIYARCNPEIGDLLYIKDGATTGICCINKLDEEFSMLSSVALIKLPTVILNEYLLRVMRSPYYYDLMRVGMSGVAITRVTLTKMKASVIPIPPLEEQKAIVEKVNKLMALWDKLEKEIETHQTTQKQWMKSCLREVVNL